jgi:hypothetical protein
MIACYVTQDVVIARCGVCARNPSYSVGEGPEKEKDAIRANQLQLINSSSLENGM